MVTVVASLSSLELATEALGVEVVAVWPSEDEVAVVIAHYIAPGFGRVALMAGTHQ